MKRRSLEPPPPNYAVERSSQPIGAAPLRDSLCGIRGQQWPRAAQAPAANVGEQPAQGRDHRRWRLAHFESRKP